MDTIPLSHTDQSSQAPFPRSHKFSYNSICTEKTLCNTCTDNFFENVCNKLILQPRSGGVQFLAVNRSGSAILAVCWGKDGKLCMHAETSFWSFSSSSPHAASKDNYKICTYTHWISRIQYLPKPSCNYSYRNPPLLSEQVNGSLWGSDSAHAVLWMRTSQPSYLSSQTGLNYISFDLLS